MYAQATQGFIRDAERRLADHATFARGVRPFMPLAILQSYAIFRSSSEGGCSGDVPVESWHPQSISDLVREFCRDVGHACDASAIAFTPIAAEAVGVAHDDLVFRDSETDDILVIEPSVPLSGYDADDEVGNTDKAVSAMAGLSVLMPGLGFDRAAREALRQVLAFAEECGIGGDEHALAGFGAWAAERLDPDCLQGHDVSISRTVSPGM